MTGQGCQSITGSLPALNLLLPIYIPRSRRLSQSKASCLKTQRSAPARTWTRTVWTWVQWTNHLAHAALISLSMQFIIQLPCVMFLSSPLGPFSSLPLYVPDQVPSFHVPEQLFYHSCKIKEGHGLDSYLRLDDLWHDDYYIFHISNSRFKNSPWYYVIHLFDSPFFFFRNNYFV